VKALKLYAHFLLAVMNDPELGHEYLHRAKELSLSRQGNA
jgi:hypothetical protein